MVLFRYGKCIKHYKTLLRKYFAILNSNCIKEYTLLFRTKCIINKKK